MIKESPVYSTILWYRWIQNTNSEGNFPSLPLVMILLLSSCILCIAIAEILAEYTKQGLRAATGRRGRVRNRKRRRRPRDTMGRDGTIVLAAAGAAATTMHNETASLRAAIVVRRRRTSPRGGPPKTSARARA